jgi:hypothetical protein
VYICHIFLIHSSVVGHLGHFQSLTSVNNSVINTGVQVVLLYPGAYLFRYIVIAFFLFNVNYSLEYSLQCRLGGHELL